MSEPSSSEPARRGRLARRFAERRATWADRRARRKAKIGTNPGDAADIASAAHMGTGGFFTTDPHRRP